MELKCQFNRYIYADDSGFAVIRIKIGPGRYYIAISSDCIVPPVMTEGCVIVLEGELAGKNDKYYPFYEESKFIFTSIEMVMPASKAGAIEYICGLKVKGIQESTASRIADITGPDIIGYFDEHPDMGELLEAIALPFLKQNSLESLKKRVYNTRAQKAVFDILTPFGISYKAAFKLCRAIVKDIRNEDMTVDDILDVLKPKADLITVKSCYDYCREAGISFFEADQLARELGYRPYNTARRNAYVRAIIEKIEEQGHTWSSLDRISSMIDYYCSRTAYPGEYLSKYAVYATICDHPENYTVENDGERIYKTFQWRNERIIGHHVERLNTSSYKYNFDPDISAKIEESRGLKFSKEQRRCFDLLRTSGIKIVTGNAGTGKTTVISGLLYAFTTLNPDMTVALCAPTGRAAQRMTELCADYGKTVRASTIHKLLDFKPYGSVNEATYNESNPYDADLIIVDEMSMVDTELFALLLKAIKDNAILILCGDVDQLPSVAAGRVFGDMINSERFATVRLEVNYRQGSDNNVIIDNANRVNRGEKKLRCDKEFRFIMCNNDEGVRNAVLHVVNENPAQTILSTIHKGPAGIDELNKDLQPIINKTQGPKMIFGSHTYYVGDSIMMQRNNYEAGYLNGDMGTVCSLSDNGITVELNGEKKNLSREMMQDISLAYAMTIHKSQGQEFQSVVIVLPESAKSMLARNLLYTAITRAKKSVIIISCPGGIASAIDNTRSSERKTSLKDILRRQIKAHACKSERN